jgi:sugar phosphate isomerase/epimerase
VRLAVSNIGLPQFAGLPEFRHLAALGVAGLEIAPSRCWTDTWRGLTSNDVEKLRAEAEQCGLAIVGLHSLFFDHPELGLFRDAVTRAASLDFLEHLSAVCRDLGGRTLIWGGGRRRNQVPAKNAREEAQAFIADLCRRIEGHGTSVCFEPLGPADTDFINLAREAFALAEEIDHPAFSVQLDAKALVDNSEAHRETFEAVKSRLVHFHANEPGLGVLGTSGKIDHAAFGAWLDELGYTGFVSLEQRQLSEGAPLADIARSVEILKANYGDSRR